jgi:hypothetical protein
MRVHRAQYTIRSLMIAVVVVAGLLALPGGLREIAAVLSLPCLALFAARRLLVGGHRRLAAIGFFSLAIPVNVLFAVVCASPGILSWGLFFIWLLVIMPALAGFGATWAVLATRREGPYHSRQSAWMWVIALAVLPGVTAWSVWPFYVKFLTAKPALERLADQIAAGQAVSFPQSAGPFRLAASRVDSQSGGIALLTDPNPGGPSGFVRHKGCFSPIRGDWWHVALGGGWCYHEED